MQVSLVASLRLLQSILVHLRKSTIKMFSLDIIFGTFGNIYMWPLGIALCCEPPVFFIIRPLDLASISIVGEGASTL